MRAAAEKHRSASLLTWHASRALLATVVSLVIAAAFTRCLRWQVSLHQGGIAGSVTDVVSCRSSNRSCPCSGR